MPWTCHTKTVEIYYILYCIWQLGKWWLGLTDVTTCNGALLKAPLVPIFGLMNHRLLSVSLSIRVQYCVLKFVCWLTLWLRLESWSVYLWCQVGLSYINYSGRSDKHCSKCFDAFWLTHPPQLLFCNLDYSSLKWLFCLFCLLLLSVR